MRPFLFCLLATLACGPNVEVTSATISDSNSGSAEGGTADGSAEGETCPDAPQLIAFHDALDRLEASQADLAARTEAVEAALAQTFGVAADEDADVIAAAVMAFSNATFVGGTTLTATEVRCTGSIDAATENLEICEPDAASPLLFECMGNCLVTAASDCPANAKCRGVSENCEGNCTGACELDASAACEGTCIGECDGECGCTDDQGSCQGICSGACMGICEVVAAPCLGVCDGECEAVHVETCSGPLVCNEPGSYCSLECERWAAPANASTACRDVAALASAADLRCEDPVVQLVHSYAAIVMCGDVAASIDALEDAGSALEALQVRLGAIQETLTFADTLIASLVDDNVDGSPCVILLLEQSVTRLGEVSSSLGEIANDVQTLRDAIAPQ